MKYRCTLLKDLPEYPAGTTFTAEKVLFDTHSKSTQFTYLCTFQGETHGNFVFSDTLLNNPIWVRKEIDESCLTELKCDACGGTKMAVVLLEIPHTKDRAEDNNSVLVHHRKKLVGTCICGHENELVSEFVTHTDFMIKTKQGWTRR